MAEVKEFIPKTIYDLIKDPERPDKPYYEKFYDLPVMQKLDLISSLGKNDPVWMKVSDKERVQFIYDNQLIQQNEIPAAPGALQTGEQISAVPQARETQAPEPQRTEQRTDPRTQGSDIAATVGRGVVKGLDLIPGMVTRPVGVALEAYGRVPELLGLAQPGEGNIFTGVGKTLQSPAATQPVETIVTGGKGFGSPRYGYSALEHVITSVVGTGPMAAVTSKIYPLLREGYAIPAADQIKKAMMLAGQGAALSEISKTLGAPEWAQVVTELAGGILSPSDAGKLFTALKQSPGLRKHLMPYQKERISETATEAFGGPSRAEQLTGGTVTQEAQQGALETFVEAQKQPVYAAQASLQMSEQLLEAQVARGRMLKSDLTQRLRTSDDTAIAALSESTGRLRAVEGRIAAERQTSRGAVRQMQEQGYQLGEDRIAELRTAKSTADANIAAFEQERGQINQQLKNIVRTAETERTAVQVAFRARTKGVAQLVTSLEDDLPRVTVANEKDMNDYLAYAQKHTASLAPEMAAAKTPEARARLGRAAITAEGEAGQDISAKAVTRLRDNAAAKYGIIHRNYGIEEEAQALNDIVAKYKPAFEQPSAAPGELPGVTEQIRGSFAPVSAVRDFEARVKQIGEEIKVQQTLMDAPDLDSVPLGLPDMQRFRSQLMDNLRHTSPTSQYYLPLKQLYGEVNEYFWGLGKKYPEAFDALSIVNPWYDTEVHRIMGDAPFAFANITNPLTRERLHTPDEVTRAYFGAGPGVASGTPAQAQNVQRFVRYIDDLDSIIASTHLNRESFYLSPTGYQPTVNQPATLLDAAAARNAKDRLFDAVRVQFYDAATDDAGKYVPAGAAKWLEQHAALIDSNASLKAVFQTPRNQANALRDVRAKAQGALALPEAYVQGIRDALKTAQAEGGEAVFQARQAARQKTNEARLTAEQAEVPVEQGIARERETLADVRQRLADRTREQRRQEQLARFNREDVASRTTGEMTRAQLAEEQVRSDIARAKRSERRSLADERTDQTERERQATEALQRSKDIEQQALNDYNRMFGNRNAAEHALLEDTFKRTLGTTPEDIIAQLETMDPQDRNFAYAQWFKKIGKDDTLKAALLQARWRQFLGPDGVLTSPGEAARFWQDKNKGNAVWLQRYYPEYLDNIKVVQRAMEAWETLAQNQPNAFTRQHIGVHVGITGTSFALAKMLGFGWDTASALGFTTELGLQGMSRTLHMRKVAALNQIYFNPRDVALIRNALRPRGTPQVARQAAWSVLTHAGVIGRETEPATTSELPEGAGSVPENTTP
jgi:hypothetical protein